MHVTRFASFVMGLGLALATARAGAVETGRYDNRGHLQLLVAGGMSAGRLVGLDAAFSLRYFVPSGHGIMLRFDRVVTADPAFDVGCSACQSSRFSFFDLAYAHRWIIDRGASTQWIGTLFQGVNLGLRQMVDAPSARAISQISNDWAMGAFFGAGVDLRVGAFTVGLEVEVRLLAVLSNAHVADDTLIGLRLHVGTDFGLRLGPRRTRPRAVPATLPQADTTRVQEAPAPVELPPPPPEPPRPPEPLPEVQ